MTTEFTSKTQPAGPVKLEEVWVSEQEPTALKIPVDKETRDVLLGLAHRWAEQRLVCALGMFEHGYHRDVTRLETYDGRIAEIAELLGSEDVQPVVDHARAQFGRGLADALSKFWEVFRHGSETERRREHRTLREQ